MLSVRHLAVVGFDEIVARKYLPCIEVAVRAGHLDAYSIVDLESARAEIDERVASVSFKPREVVYLPGSSPQRPSLVQSEVITEAINGIRARSGPLMVYIATEVQAHEAYLRYCVENDVDSLVEKPVLAPMADGRFAPSHISKIMEDLVGASYGSPARHSVMSLSRYHPIYNEKAVDALRDRMTQWRAPLTSFHLRAAGGVWNLQREYETRDDHPYKYGYGMLMHGAYHYVDLAVQFLSLNSLVFPDRRFKLEVSSFGAFPVDQHARIPAPSAKEFDDDSPRWSVGASENQRFGETDITSTFRLVDADSARTLTLGTLSFEQTTPSVRSWKDLPPNLYNKNGRTSGVEIEAQLSTLFSTHVHCFDVPQDANPDKVDAFARITTRANASLLPGERYVSTETFNGVFHSDSNRRLMENWLQGTETRSLLADHVMPMKLTEALARSLRNPGWPVSIDFLPQA